MTTTPIRFVFHGQSQPAGSKSAAPYRRKDGSIGVAVRDGNPKSGEWKRTVAQVAAESYDGPLLDGPLSVTMLFYRVRPKGHVGKRGVLPSAPEYPTTRPDVLKTARAVEDALTGVVWRDDAQIVHEVLGKAWGETARVEVEIVKL